MHAFQRKLITRKKEGSLRSLSLLSQAEDFFSNDYLSMAQISDQTRDFSPQGSTGSRLLSGNSRAAMEAEAALAEFFGTASALVFNSGYDANVGLLSSLPQRGDTILYDALVHASARDGIRLSQAKALSFRHNDVSDLHRLLEKSSGTVFVVIESLYSMDGDFAPLLEIATLCQKYQALLIVDEAHTGGVFGENGRGWCAELGVESSVFARLITFGKAYGTHGAAVLGSAELTDYLVNFARSFIYTTALPPEHYTHILHQVRRVAGSNARSSLQAKIALFRSSFDPQVLPSAAQSPIQVIPCSGVARCQTQAAALQALGFAVKPILSPTVAAGSERLRICLHLHNTDQAIQRLTAALQSFH